MKKLFNPLIKKLVTIKAGWPVAQSIIRLGEWFRYERSLYEHKIAEEKLKKIFSDLTVRSGLFKGLKYPEFTSFGSSLFPKLSGSYESELFDTLSVFQANKYKKIIDIGCAEGYYAVGLASKFSTSIVYAFDIDETAQKLTTAMAAINDVTDRVIVRGECSRNWLGNEDFSDRSLIICDCEGYEKELFVKENINNLENCDMVIEMHPMYIPEIRNYLVDLFKPTHHLQIVSSKDDAGKMFELDGSWNDLSKLEKLKLVQEGRAFTMDWLIAVSKYK